MRKHEPTEVTRAIVKRTSGLGLPQAQICAMLGGIDIKTLCKHYEVELVLGKAEASTKIADTLFNKAQSGDTTAMIWWTKAQMKWSETVKQEISGEGGGPLTVQLLPQDEQA